MSSLEVVDGPAAGLRLELSGTPLTLGRDELGGDPELSRQHLRLSVLGDGRVLAEDLGSTNGTFVNGRRIPAPTLLEPGDELKAGTSSLRLASAHPAPSIAPPEVPERHLALRVVAGWAPGAFIPIGGEPVTVGRRAAGAAALGEDADIGGEHARLSPTKDGRVLLEDLGSPAGTRLRGERIPAPTIIGAGDQLQIGGSTLELIETAGQMHEPSTEASRVLGGVREVPQGLFARIAARAPVTREEVVQVLLFALGWGIALNMLIRTFVIDVLDVPEDLRSIHVVQLLIATVIPITANSAGFYKAFHRPDDLSFKRYLVPTFGVPTLITVLDLVRLNHHGGLDILVTVLVTVLPVALVATLMLRLRERAARERVGSLRAG